MTARNIGQPVPTVLDAQQARAKDRLECARRIKPVRTTGGLIHHVADIAAIEQQQIGVRLQQIQRFEQHLPLGAVGRMKRGVQRQLRPRQEQRERVMVGTPFMALAGSQPASGCRRRRPASGRCSASNQHGLRRARSGARGPSSNRSADRPRRALLKACALTARVRTPRPVSSPDRPSSSACTRAHMPDIISAAMRGNVSVRLRVKAAGERRTRSASAGSNRKSENSARSWEDAGV